MNQTEFRTSIVSAFSRLNELGLTNWSMFPNQKSLELNREFMTVALDSRTRYDEVYRTGLSLLHYNFVLEDYSYFQFSVDGTIRGYRYAFYANPYEISPSFSEFSKIMISEGEIFALGELYMQELDEAELSYEIPPVRYDYDPNAYFPARHPAGHLHIGVFQGSRVAVRRVLSPLTFALFIAKNYYPDNWNTYERNEVNNDVFSNPYDRHLANSKNACALVESDLFTESEELLPFLD